MGGKTQKNFKLFAVLLLLSIALMLTNVNSGMIEPIATPTPTPIVTPSPTPWHGGGGGGGGTNPTATPVHTPTPTPVTYPTAPPSGNGNNLAPLDDGAWLTDVTWQTVPTSNIYHETSITHNGAYTFKVVPQAGNDNAGCDHWGPGVHAGDHIVMSCWMKTGGTVQASYAGARMGFDIYGAGENMRITGVHSLAQAQDGCRTPSNDQSIDTNYVHWGLDWTLRTWDFVMPATFISDGGSANINSNYAKGQAVAPVFMVPWLQVWCDDFPGGAKTCYFSDFQIYVNP